MDFTYGDRVFITPEAANKLAMPINGVHTVINHFKESGKVEISINNGRFKVGAAQDFTLVASKLFTYTYFGNLNNLSKFRYRRATWIKSQDYGLNDSHSTICLNIFDIVYCRKSDISNFPFFDTALYQKLKSLHC